MKRAYLNVILLTTGLLVTGAVAVNTIVDPMRYYHAPWFEIGFSDNQRHQNPGLARTMSYEAALIGTSHTEHFVTSQIGEAMGGEALNLSISGSLIAEQSLMLRTLLDQGKVTKVLWEMNYPSFSLGDLISEPDSFPRYLYEPGAETPFRYLVSRDTFLESFSALRGTRPRHLDELHRWDVNATFGEQQVLAHWSFMSQRWTDRLRSSWDRYAVRENEIPGLLSRYVGDLVSSAPDIEFILVLLPATLLEFGNDLQIADRRLDRRLALRNEIANLAERHANIRLMDFQTVEWMTDPANYKDIDHFNQQVVAGILERVAGDRYTRPDELRAGTDELRRRIVDFMDTFCSSDPGNCQQALLRTLSRFRERTARN